MSIFGNILSKIFPTSHPAVAKAEAATPAPSAPSAATVLPPPAAPPSAGLASPAPAATATTSGPPVDVEQILNDKAAKNPQKLNWKSSIVDLMKLLDMDSSFASRQALARELQYSGDMSDSASVNVWLHRQVMTKLAQNGGKVPAELRD